ncbi:MAG: hypothetical protein A4S09_16920 [Proteobacteria bacterium SG_bin7]|nr:MAG: hypothetical protein A4S09_16920 [Proteobacteria bacterium SG_bin7]
MTKSIKILGAISLAVAALFITGCATDISSQSYSDQHVGETARSYRARVVKVRQVKVGPDELGKNKTGALAGGVGGAVLGSTMGGGNGNGLMAIAGGVAGAIGGAYAEKALKTQVGLEITVELRNGKLMTVVQGSDVPFSRGERVILMSYGKGRSKIVKEEA